MPGALHTKLFDFTYPESLVATEPRLDFRTMWVAGHAAPKELQPSEIIQIFKPGDLLILNDTKVLKRRVTTPQGLEILFLESLPDNTWEVLFPAREVKDNTDFPLPGGFAAQLVERGLPQKIKVSGQLTEDYFSEHGELALPPYIQKARGERHNRGDESAMYQTAWAQKPGSYAAPTASLHFQNQDLEKFRAAGVRTATLTLHVGLGTFLPVKAENLSDHKMHAEEIFIPRETIEKIVATKKAGGRVWALGTTVTRALESWARGKLSETSSGDIEGSSDLFITPGFQFEVVDALMTNFHQPKSTLLALVSAWAGRENVLSAYQWAIEKKFRLFSYGDLTIWTR
jgi:S-adenosylmethionine:tRNA ribosyltransferase-isomerase